MVVVRILYPRVGCPRKSRCPTRARRNIWSRVEERMTDHDRWRSQVGSREWSLLLAGEHRVGRGAEQPVEDPATGAVLTHVRTASADDVDDTVRRAADAAELWRGTAPRARA